MRSRSSLLGALAWLAAGCVSSPPSGADPQACQPGCDGGALCCPWSSRVCADAGCAPKGGYVCIDADPGDGCPALQFEGAVTVDGG